MFILGIIYFFKFKKLSRYYILYKDFNDVIFTYIIGEILHKFIFEIFYFLFIYYYI